MKNNLVTFHKFRIGIGHSKGSTDDRKQASTHSKKVISITMRSSQKVLTITQFLAQQCYKKLHIFKTLLREEEALTLFLYNHTVKKLCMF